MLIETTKEMQDAILEEVFYELPIAISDEYLSGTVFNCLYRERSVEFALTHWTLRIDYTMPIKEGGWDCCKAEPNYIVVFNNGVRWAVCRYCANQYTGPVYRLEN